MFETNKRLYEQYLNILDESKEFRHIWQYQQAELSELFVARVPETYDGSSNQIMHIIL